MIEIPLCWGILACWCVLLVHYCLRKLIHPSLFVNVCMCMHVYLYMSDSVCMLISVSLNGHVDACIFMLMVNSILMKGKL